MTESKSKQANWIRSWIEQLQQLTETATASDPVSGLLAGLPSLGLAREQTQAWRELTAAQGECQKLQQELCAVLAQVQADALSMLETRVHEREASSVTIGTRRELYDLWIECGEQIYSRVAHSEAFCRLQAELSNATMRLRARQQAVIEQGLKQFDLPTRSELNTAHRQVRELRARVAALEAQLPEVPGRDSGRFESAGAGRLSSNESPGIPARHRGRQGAQLSGPNRRGRK